MKIGVVWCGSAMESEGVIDVEAEGQREEALQAVLKCPNPPQVSQPTSPTQLDAH